MLDLALNKKNTDARSEKCECGSFHLPFVQALTEGAAPIGRDVASN